MKCSVKHLRGQEGTKAFGENNMIHHSVPGERSFAILQEAVYQNSTYGRSTTRIPSEWRAKLSQIHAGKNNNNNNNNNNAKMKPSSGPGYSVSSGTAHHIYANASELIAESEQNIPPSTHGSPRRSTTPPSPPDHPPPLPPKRTTSLMENPHPQQQQQFIPRLDSTITVNPKRVSIATSTFWDGHPELGHFVSGWELGRDESTNSVWGTTERGGSECVNIWGDPPAVKKGILLLQRDKLLSRWKERYCILTRDYLHCFRRTTSIHRSGVRLSEMGTFMFKLRLADVETIEWESRKSGPIIVIFLPSESRLLIRTPSDTYEALEQWHTLLQECIYMSKERRRALRHGSSTNVSAMTTLRSTISKASEPVLGSSSSESSSGSSSSCHSSERPQYHPQQQNHHPFPQDKSSMRKNIGRMSLKLTQSNSKIDNVHNKYSPSHDIDEDYEEVLDEEEEEEDEFLSQIHFPVNKRGTRASIAVVERSSAGPSMTLHDFVKNPWKSSSSSNNNNNNQNGGISKRAGQYIPGDYSMPRDAIGRRPESWHMYRPFESSNSSSNNSANRNGQVNGWAGKSSSPMMSSSFSRGKDSLYSTSRHTSEITFRKMS